MGDYIRVSANTSEDRQIDSPDPRQKAQKQKMVSPQKSMTDFDPSEKPDESQVRYEEDDITATSGVTTSQFTLPVSSAYTNGNFSKKAQDGNLYDDQTDDEGFDSLRQQKFKDRAFFKNNTLTSKDITQMDIESEQENDGSWTSVIILDREQSKDQLIESRRRASFGDEPMKPASGPEGSLVTLKLRDKFGYNEDLLKFLETTKPGCFFCKETAAIFTLQLGTVGSSEPAGVGAVRRDQDVQTVLLQGLTDSCPGWRSLV